MTKSVGDVRDAATPILYDENDEPMVQKGTDGSAHSLEGGKIAGERHADLEDGTDYLTVSGEWNVTTIQGNIGVVTVTTVPALIQSIMWKGGGTAGVMVGTGAIQDWPNHVGSSTQVVVATVGQSSGSWYLGGAKISDTTHTLGFGINGGGAGDTVTVVWKPQ